MKKTFALIGAATELHTESYREILAGNGFGLDVVRPAVQLVSDIRRAPVAALGADHHPLCRAAYAV